MSRIEGAGSVVYDPDEPLWVTPDLAANVAEVNINTIRQWKARGLVRSNDRGCYSLRDVWNWLEQRNQSQVRKLTDPDETMTT
jgi:phage terminase Nu1 subunit (DNA packaging protein)